MPRLMLLNEAAAILMGWLQLQPGLPLICERSCYPHKFLNFVGQNKSTHWEGVHSAIANLARVPCW